MKRQSQVLLAVAFVAAGAAGCFKDPVSGLRNGPAVLTVGANAVFVKTFDSTAVIAYLKDDAGNVLPQTGVTWEVAGGDPTVAIVRNDTTQPIPGQAYSRAFIRGVDSVQGGWTNVIVTSRGISDTIRVTVIPSKLTKQHVAYSGPILTDTVLKPADVLIPGDTLKRYPYNAPDTLVLNGTALLKFDTSKVTVQVATTNGSSRGLIVSKTPSQIRVVFQVGTAGKVMVQHLLLTPGNAQIGTVKVDTLIGDSIAVAPFRINPATFGGGASVTNNVVTVTAPAGWTFSSASTAGFGGSPAPVVAQTPTSLSAISAASGTRSGAAVVYKVVMPVGDPAVGSVTFDSLATNDQAYTMSQAGFPDAGLFSPNNGALGDTIVLTAPAGMSFSTSGALSQVIFGNPADSTSDTAWVVSLAAGQLKALPRRGGTSKVVATNMSLALPGAVPFSLASINTQTVDNVASDFPRGVSLAAARVMTIPAANVDTVYGAINTAAGPVNAAGAVSDFWTFTTSAAHAIHAVLGWYGSGNPYSSGLNTPANTNDLDLTVCDATMACDETDPADLLNYAAAKTTQPESGTSAVVPAAQYWVGVALWTPDGGRTVAYRLIITLQ